MSSELMSMLDFFSPIGLAKIGPKCGLDVFGPGRVARMPTPGSDTSRKKNWRFPEVPG